MLIVMSSPQTVADQLRAAIRKSGRSQYELAKAADVSQSLLSNFLAEGSTKTLNLETAQAIARALGIKLTIG